MLARSCRLHVADCVENAPARAGRHRPRRPCVERAAPLEVAIREARDLGPMPAGAAPELRSDPRRPRPGRTSRTRWRVDRADRRAVCRPLRSRSGSRRLDAQGARGSGSHRALDVRGGPADRGRDRDRRRAVSRRRHPPVHQPDGSAVLLRADRPLDSGIAAGRGRRRHRPRRLPAQPDVGGSCGRMSTGSHRRT